MNFWAICYTSIWLCIALCTSACHRYKFFCHLAWLVELFYFFLYMVMYGIFPCPSAGLYLFFVAFNGFPAQPQDFWDIFIGNAITHRQYFTVVLRSKFFQFNFYRFASSAKINRRWNFLVLHYSGHNAPSSLQLIKSNNVLITWVNIVKNASKSQYEGDTSELGLAGLFPKWMAWRCNLMCNSGWM